MAKKNELEFANFILRFGNDRVLIDFIEEIVIPAFTSDLERSYGDTRYFLCDVEIVDFGTDEHPILCIIGRFIKDTLVKREQVFDDENNELIKDDESLRTSPSAIFTLVLNNHRLLYFSETNYAPSIISFRATIDKFLRNKYQDFINNLYQEQQSIGVTKSELYREYAPPTLEIVPLTNEESLEDFIDQYEMLRTVEIKLLTTNNDIDNNGFFIQQARQAKDEVHSTVTTIVHNNSKDGLSKKAIARQLETALKQGNSKVKLKGKDKRGNKLEGSNENFKIRANLSEVPKTISGIASKSYETFQDFVDQGVIRIGEARENVLDKIKRLREKR